MSLLLLEKSNRHNKDKQQLCLCESSLEKNPNAVPNAQIKYIKDKLDNKYHLITYESCKPEYICNNMPVNREISEVMSYNMIFIS